MPQEFTLGHELLFSKYLPNFFGPSNANSGKDAVVNKQNQYSHVAYRLVEDTDI